MVKLSDIPILEKANWDSWAHNILLVIYDTTKTGGDIVTGRRELPADALADKNADLWNEACVALDIIVGRIKPEDYVLIDRWCDQEQKQPYHKYHPRSVWIALESMCRSRGGGCTVT